MPAWRLGPAWRVLPAGIAFIFWKMKSKKISLHLTIVISHSNAFLFSLSEYKFHQKTFNVKTRCTYQFVLVIGTGIRTRSISKIRIACWPLLPRSKFQIGFLFWFHRLLSKSDKSWTSDLLFLKWPLCQLPHFWLNDDIYLLSWSERFWAHLTTNDCLTFNKESTTVLIHTQEGTIWCQHNKSSKVCFQTCRYWKGRSTEVPSLMVTEFGVV